MGRNFNESKARRIFNDVDVDNSGRLDLLEFLDAISAMSRGEAGGFGSMGFKDALKDQMGALKRKLAEAEAKMNALAGGLKGRAAEKDRSKGVYDQQVGARRNKQAELDSLAAQMAPQKTKLELMAQGMAPLRS